MSAPDELRSQLPDISLALYAYRQEGRTPVIVAHSTYWALTPEQRSGKDYLVLQDETYDWWMQGRG